MLRRSATQTIGTGWNPYTGAGLVNATAAVALARIYDTTPPTTVSLTAVPRSAASRSTSSAPTRRPRKSLAGGLTVALDASRDGVVTTPPPYRRATPELSQLDPDDGVPRGLARPSATPTTTAPSSVAEPAHRTRAPPAPKARPKLSLRASSASTRSKLKVSLALGKRREREASSSSNRGRARSGARSTGSRSASARPVTRTEHVTRGRVSYKLRAHLLASAELPLQATSGSITLRVTLGARARASRPVLGGAERLEVLLDLRHELVGEGAVDQAVIEGEREDASSSGCAMESLPSRP